MIVRLDMEPMDTPELMERIGALVSHELTGERALIVVTHCAFTPTGRRCTHAPPDAWAMFATTDEGTRFEWCAVCGALRFDNRAWIHPARAVQP